MGETGADTHLLTRTLTPCPASPALLDEHPRRRAVQPYPLVFGGAIRLYHLVRMLSTFSDVTLLCYRSWDGEDPTEHLEQICEHVILNDTRPESSGLRRARSIVSRSSYQALAHRSGDLQRDLDGLVQRRRFDAVLVEMTPMGLFRLPTGTVTVLDMQNIEHELVARRRAPVAENALRRAMLTSTPGRCGGRRSASAVPSTSC